jgi:hypothetical protein
MGVYGWYKNLEMYSALKNLVKFLSKFILTVFVLLKANQLELSLYYRNFYKPESKYYL